MDLVSLFITFIGIVVLLGLFIMSRLYDQSPVKQSGKTIKIPKYTDTTGEELSSVKADFPAKGTGQPIINPSFNKKNFQRGKSPQQGKSHQQTNSANSKNQYVLFIASPSSQLLDGNKIIAAMAENNLKMGVNDIYHYFVEDDKSLFSIANGVSPWTLKKTDLVDKTVPGLSLIMQIPTPIDKKEAIELFIETGKKLAENINGELQNTQQEIFLETDKEIMLANI